MMDVQTEGQTLVLLNAHKTFVAGIRRKEMQADFSELQLIWDKEMAFKYHKLFYVISLQNTI